MLLVSGKASGRLPHAGGGGGGGSTGPGFVPLTEARQLPVGAQIDAGECSDSSPRRRVREDTDRNLRRGGIRACPVDQGSAEGPDNLVAARGRFSRRAVVRKVPGAGRCRSHVLQAPRPSRRVLQLLHASASGRFRTRGRYSAATVRGTARDTADRCDDPDRVRRGTVIVNDFVRHKTVAVHAGHSYLARAPGH